MYNSKMHCYRVTKSKILFGLLFCFFSHLALAEEKPLNDPFRNQDSNTIQQNSILSGVVLDNLGDPIIGATVLIKGSDRGTVTDIDGNFTLHANEGDVLLFSCIGYQALAYKVEHNREITIRLQEDTELLEELVVVGYGVQKKVNLSGAVQSISSKGLANRAIPNVNSGLQGLAPNLNITSSSGRANDAPSLNIRGFTSINGGEVFILLDNVPISSQELSRINPDDIENISVLKDAASAAIYGARAAFGVILITTKKAKNKDLQINFSANYGIRNRGRSPRYITDPHTVMDMKNAAARPLYAALYSEAQMEYAKEVIASPDKPRVILNPTNQNLWDYYGETDWQSEAFRDNSPTYQANINLSKKDDKLSYFLSSGHYRQDGLLRFGNDVMNRYNFRGNAEMIINDRWKVGSSIAYNHEKYDSPSFLDGVFFHNVNRKPSLSTIYNPDGTWTQDGANTLGALQSGGRSVDRTNELQISANSQFDIIKELWTVNADMNFRRTNSNRDKHNLAVPYRIGPNQPLQYSLNDRGGNEFAEFTARERDYNVYNIYSTFSKTFNEKNYLSVMMGYNREYGVNRIYFANKELLITDQLPQINLATGAMKMSNNLDELALEGYFGRINYIFNNKYILEFNGRYDASSRFPVGDRWGFFPSGSFAWSLINEDFFTTTAEKLHLSNLKFRASYGSLGNQNVTNSAGEQMYYPYIPTMNAGPINTILDGALPIAVYQPGLVAPTFTWEKVRTINGGFDLSLFKGRFDVTFDAYQRRTDDMLTLSKELPAVIGAAPPKTNAANLVTKGWELTVGWRDQVMLNNSPFTWSVNFMLADSRTKITKYDNPTRSIGKSASALYEGREIGEIWGFINDGFFQSEDELNAIDQTEVGTDDQSFKYYVGDTRFKDLNGDGKITFGSNTVDDPGDRKIIGNSSNRYPYSIDINLSWKGFDIRTFFQGIGKRDWYPGAGNFYFWGVYAQPWTNVTEKNMDHWTEERRDAYFPRVKAYSAEDNDELGAPQTKYLQDASYLRLKNLTIGYTFPKTICEKIKISHMRLFFTSDNLLTISHLKVDLDPEVSTRSNQGKVYPLQHSYSLGVNIHF